MNLEVTGRRFRVQLLFAWVYGLLASSATVGQAAESVPESRRRALLEMSSEISSMYREFAVSNHIPGLAFGVVLDGQLVVSGAYGLADLAKKVPATVRTPFRIASMTKSLTAMAILQLRDQGRIRLESPARKYVRELRVPRLPTRDSPDITIRDLLVHEAGFPEDNPWGDRQLADSDEELSDLLKGGVSFSNPPGVSYEYSNLGYALLGRVVSKASGRKYQSWVDQRILAPLGMHSTTWSPGFQRGEALATGYRWEEEQWKEERPLGDGAYASMGGMISTLEDFAKYVVMHLDAWPPDDRPESWPLKRSSLRQMQHPGGLPNVNVNAKRSDGTPCPVATAYAHGLIWSRNCDNQVRLSHSGGLPGYGSNWRMIPSHGLAVICLANRTYANAGAINTAVLDRILAGAKTGAREIPVSDTLSRRRDELWARLPEWKDGEPGAVFAENFFADYPVHLLRKECGEKWKAIGRIRKVDPLVPENRLRGTFQVHGELGRLDIFLSLSPENPPRIQAFRAEMFPDESRTEGSR